MINKERLKKEGRRLIWAAKETGKFAAPAIVSIPVAMSGHPEIAEPILLSQVPYAAGYTGYHYIKAYKHKKKK